MDLRDTDTSIAYQNKDIVSKFFGQQMKGKSLSLFGLKNDLKVVDVCSGRRQRSDFRL